MQIRTAQHDAAVRAIHAARIDIGREIDPNCISPALPAPEGPFFWIDGRVSNTFAALPEILAEHFRREGVPDAVLTIPTRSTTLYHPETGLDACRWAVVLHLCLPPGRYDRPTEMPDSWLAEAEAWVRAVDDASEAIMIGMEGGVEYSLRVDALAGFFRRARQARPVRAIAVSGKLEGQLRAANGCFYGATPRLLLAGGGPSADDHYLTSTFLALVAIARRLAPDVACAFIAVDPTFRAFNNGSTGSTWEWNGGEASQFIEPISEEYLFGVYPYQVLGPGHLARLARVPEGAASLAGSRMEVAIGDLGSWLFASEPPSMSRDIDACRRDPSVPTSGQAVLAGCLLRRGEGHDIARFRPA